MIHECLSAEVALLDDPTQGVEAAAEMAEWGPTFRRRLQGLGQDARPCFPVALYMDGARFTKSIMPGHMDLLLNITVCNIVTQKRHFTGMLRKSEFCRCGCLGW